MPWENIGSCGTACAKWDRDWMVAQTELAVAYVRHVCGELPIGCEVDVMWHEHDIADYCTVGLCWEHEECEQPPWEYIQRAEIALRAFEDAVSWEAIHPEIVRGEFLEEEE